jgi:uncharacterized membrane-anchored protein
MKFRILAVISAVCICALIAVGQSSKRKSAPSPSPTPDIWEGYDGVNFLKGPSVGELGINAQVKLPDGYIFADAKDTRTIMEMNRNTVSGRELGFIAPSDDFWFVVFEFDDVGYVKDDEKDSLDADAILESIRTATEEGNKERAKRGWPAMTVLGWEQRPHYDDVTKNLAWAVRAQSDGDPVVNYNTRLLGRGGVMEVTLVTDPASLTQTLPKFKSMLSGFDFKQGHRYAEFSAGDKTAAYGLTGLIVGGGTAVLVKSGAFKWIWKALIAVGIGVAALVKKLFSRNRDA